MYKLVTKAPLNIRSGPGMSFEIIGSYDKGKLLESWEFRKDGGKIGWYKTTDGWVCANYVSLSTEMYSEVKSATKITRAVQTAGDSSGNTESVDVGEVRGSGRNSDGIVPGVSGGEDTPIADAVLAKRAFGVPYQFIETTDVRAGNVDAELGIDMKQCLQEAPMISLCAGKPFFIPEMNQEEKKDFIQNFFNTIQSSLQKPNNISDFSNLNGDLKYFDFEPDPFSFFNYVNTITKMFAVYLGIGNEIVPGSNNITFNMMDWSNYTLANLFAGRATYDNRMNLGSSRLDQQLSSDYAAKGGGVAGAVGAFIQLTEKEPYYVDFFINPRVSFSETFSNQTKDSMLAGLANQGSDLAKEFAFMVATGTSVTDMNESYGNMQKKIEEAMNSFNGNSIIKRIIGGASSIISGNNMLFPKIWGGSDYSKSYSVDIELKSPYGDKISIFMNILLPLSFLLAFTLPRQATVNTFGSPFIVQGYLPGFCAINMGMVSNLTISKGGDGGDAWSVDGLPLQMNIQLNVDDLYHNMMMSGAFNVAALDVYNMLWNTGLIDFVSINSGVSIKQTNRDKMMELLEALFKETGDRIVRGANIRARQMLPSIGISAMNRIRGAAGSVLSNI